MPQHTFHPRFTVTLCFDVATRMLLGHRISSEPPNLQNVLLTLQQVNEHARPWDSWGAPKELQIDSSCLSTSLLQSLTDLDNDGARRLDREF